MTISANRFMLPTSQFHTPTGPGVGCKYKFYLSGTSTPASVYTGVGLTGPVTSVTLNASGMPDVDIFLDPAVNYRLVITDANDTALWTFDNVDDLARDAIANFTIFAGNPNGSVAGTAGVANTSPADVIFDTSNNILWVCTTTGSASTAVWTNVSAQFSGSVAFSGVISPGSISTDQDNWNPTGLSTASAIRVALGADVKITGLSGGSAGREITLINTSSTNYITLMNNVTSTAANRFQTPGRDQLVPPNSVIVLTYDAVTARWRIKAQPVVINPGDVAFMQNVAFTATVGSNILTVALKTERGNDPTPGEPCVICFRSSTVTNGDYTIAVVTSALSIALSSGSTVGFAASETNTIHVGFILVGDATVELALSNDGALWTEDRLVSTTAEGGAGAADSRTTLYSTTARSNVQCRLACVLLITTGGTPGQWGSNPTRVSTVRSNPYQPFGNTIKSRSLWTELTTTALQECFNVSSLTDDGTGMTTHTLAVAMPKATYAVAVSEQRSHASDQLIFGLAPSATASALAASTIATLGENGAGNNEDARHGSFIASGP